MKKITNYILICTCALGFSSCVNGSLPMEVYSITWMRHPIFLLVSDIRMVWGPV